jgi:hypothetical protein
MQHIPVLQEQSQPHPKQRGGEKEGNRRTQKKSFRKKGSNYKHEKKFFLNHVPKFYF